jgi:polar amino acid transport system substrate-binding protein
MKINVYTGGIKMIKKVITIVMAALLVISLVGCNKAADSKSQSGTTPTAAPTAAPTATPAPTKAPTSVDKIKQAGKIVMGTEATFPPFEGMDPKDGKTIVGFDIDIAAAVAKKLGVKLEIMDTKFEGLIPALQTDMIDFVAAGMTATPDRAKTVDFSQVYYTGLQVLVVKTDNDSINTGADMNGKKIGAQIGTTSAEAANSIPGIKFKDMDKVDQLMLSVKNGTLDGVVVDDTVGVEYVKTISGLKIVKVADLNKEAGGMGIAIKKGNAELLKVINDTIDELKANGEFDKLIDKWGLLK